MHARAWTCNAREISPKLVSQLVSVAPDLLLIGLKGVLRTAVSSLRHVQKHFCKTIYD